jgi:hypothetical protein
MMVLQPSCDHEAKDKNQYIKNGSEEIWKECELEK